MNHLEEFCFFTIDVLLFVFFTPSASKSDYDSSFPYRFRDDNIITTSFESSICWEKLKISNPRPPLIEATFLRWTFQNFLPFYRYYHFWFWCASWWWLDGWAFYDCCWQRFLLSTARNMMRSVPCHVFRNEVLSRDVRGGRGREGGGGEGGNRGLWKKRKEEERVETGDCGRRKKEEKQEEEATVKYLVHSIIP